MLPVRSFSTIPAGVNESFAIVKSLDPSFETQGVMLFRNIFTAAPDALQLFSFRDVPNLYESPALKRHGAGVFKAVEKALNDLEGAIGYLEKLGGTHVAKDVKPAHYTVVRDAVLLTLEQGLGDKFTAPLRAEWTAILDKVIAVMTKDRY